MRIRVHALLAFSNLPYCSLPALFLMTSSCHPSQDTPGFFLFKEGWSRIPHPLIPSGCFFFRVFQVEYHAPSLPPTQFAIARSPALFLMTSSCHQDTPGFFFSKRDDLESRISNSIGIFLFPSEFFSSTTPLPSFLLFFNSFNSYLLLIHTRTHLRIIITIGSSLRTHVRYDVPTRTMQ